MNKISDAMVFAIEKHKGQKDDSGKDYYFAHILPIYYMIKELTQDEEVIIAAILHDTLEDTKTTEQELELKFGKRVADLVLELTHEGKANEYGYYFPRLKSKEAIMIKLLDRASNISRMDAWDKPRQEHYLKKTKFWKSEQI